MLLHPELGRLLALTDAAETEARSIVDGLTDAQANWQPNNGRAWSIVQCLDHLAKINVFYVAHFLGPVRQATTAGCAPFRHLSPTWFGLKFVALLGPPPKARMKAPKISMPARSIPGGGALESYVRSHDGYRLLVEAANHLDVNRVTAPNPFVKAIRMRVSTVLLLIPAHDQRHLWQARQVLQASEFPR